MKRPKAATAHHAGMPQGLGGAVPPMSWFTLRSQGPHYGKHSQAVGHQKGADVLVTSTLEEVIRAPCSRFDIPR